MAVNCESCIRQGEAIKIYITRKSGGKRAIIGVARRLVGRIRSCLLSGKLYQIDIIEKKMTEECAPCFYGEKIFLSFCNFVGDYAHSRCVYRAI